jgi:hypothetical protein
LLELEVKEDDIALLALELCRNIVAVRPIADFIKRGEGP